MKIGKNRKKKKKERLYICNIKKPKQHCKLRCLHGIKHKADGCTKEEYCNITKKRVTCKLIKKGEKHENLSN